MEFLLKKMYQPRDPAALGIARFFYGFIMILDIFEERGLPYLIEKWGDTDHCYFPLFNNLSRLPIEYMYMVYFVLLISAFGIMLGFMYRVSSFMFVIAYWYIFFLDKTKWNNHSYLYGLSAILFFFTNAHYYWSVDALLWPSIRNKTVPRWHYSIFKFQLFILYFFAGLKKLDRDWVDGYSMSGLSRKWIFDPFRAILTNDQIDYFMVHLCGLILDLSAGFLLYFDQTRIVGFALAYSFHGMNAVMFNIGMFSYVCMAFITIFCRPDWPKNVFRCAPALIQRFLPLISSPQKNMECYPSEPRGDVKPNTVFVKNGRKYISALFFTLFISIQIILPWSHSITKGYNSWTQGLYGYSWDMMVHSWSTQHVVVKVIDGETNEKTFLRPGAFLPEHNKGRILSHPDMLKQYAVCLADRIQSNPEIDIRKPKIYFDIWKSLNSRFQQRMFDPTIDIVTAEWHPLKETTWIRPLLVELSPWRSTLSKIKSINTFHSNSTDIVFVADFPGLYLENFIAPEIFTNITVLQGTVIVEVNDFNTTVELNDTLTIESNTTHKVYTIGDVPSCYMYIYKNTTWSELTEEQIIKSDPDMEKDMLKQQEWNNKSFLEKVYAFYYKKYRIYKAGLWQIYYAFNVIFDIDDDYSGSNDEL